MKYIIILGDGMADHPVRSLGNLTPLQYAHTPNMDHLAQQGRTGILSTIPHGFKPGSEVANTAILGYDLDSVYEGRGVLEAASIGYDMMPDDMAMRCNIITLGEGRIINHHGGYLSSEESAVLIDYLNEHLSDERVRFYTGTHYRHLLVIKGGNKHIACSPPHDYPNQPWEPLLVKPIDCGEAQPSTGRMSAEETAGIINGLILRSQQLLSNHPINLARIAKGTSPANSIWPWSPGYRPLMQPLSTTYQQIHRGAVITAVDLIKGIGKYAGLQIINVPGATGMPDTNYEGKAQAAIEALRTNDFVFLHIEATDEASHDGDIPLKIKAIEDLDSRVVGPIYNALRQWHDTPVCIAVLPDHPTPVEVRTHVNEPVPFAIWYPGITPDSVRAYNEIDCSKGAYGHIQHSDFMDIFMASKSNP